MYIMISLASQNVIQDIVDPGIMLEYDEDLPWLGVINYDKEIYDFKPVPSKYDAGPQKDTPFFSSQIKDNDNFKAGLLLSQLINSNPALKEIKGPSGIFRNVEQSGRGMSGRGMDNYINMIINNADKIQKGLEITDDLLFGKVGTSVSNYMQRKLSTNPNARPGFIGEKHAIIDGARANFLGPGTHLKTRLERGDKGVDRWGLDEAAKRHDIAYANATSYEDIRAADDVFIDDVETSNAGNLMKTSLKSAIKAKKVGEDLGLFDKDRYLTEQQKESFGSKSGQGKHGFDIIRDTRKMMKGKLKSPAQYLRKKG